MGNNTAKSQWLSYSGQLTDEWSGGIANFSNGDIATAFSVSNSNGSSSVVVQRLNTSGAVVWSLDIGADYAPGAGSVLVGADDKVYVTGGTKKGAIGESGKNDSDIFAAAISGYGQKLWYKNYGIGIHEIGSSAVLDANGNILLEGRVSEVNDGYSFIKDVPNFYGAEFSGGWRGFQLRINPVDGTVSKAYTTGSGNSGGGPIAIDRSRNIAFVAGYTFGAVNGVETVGNGDPNGANTYLIARNENNGAVLWTRMENWMRSNVVAQESENAIYFVDKGNLEKVNGSTGQTIWTKALTNTGYTLSPIAGGGVLLSESESNGSLTIRRFDANGTETGTQVISHTGKLYPRAFIEQGDGTIQISGSTSGTITVQSGTTVVTPKQAGNDSFVLQINSAFSVAPKVISPVVRGNSLYTVVDGPSWTQAEANSVKLGGHLVTINSAEENRFIVDLYAENQVFQRSINATSVDYRAWFGLVPTSQQNWRWADGTKPHYYNWVDTQIATNGVIASNDGGLTAANNGFPIGQTFNLNVSYASWSNGKWENGTPGGEPSPGVHITEQLKGISETPFIRRGDSAYVIVQGPTWEEAEANAVKLGGHLVTINDAAENDWLFENGFRGWIGFTDKAEEGNWKWTSGESVTYINWLSDSPSNTFGTEHYANNGSRGWGDSNNDGYGNVGPGMKYGTAEIKLAPNIRPIGTPTLSGNFKAGQVITIDNVSIRDLDNFAGYTPEFKYSWEVSADGIAWTKLSTTDATDNNNLYTLTTSEIGKQVRGVVSYLDGHGTYEAVETKESEKVLNQVIQSKSWSVNAFISGDDTYEFYLNGILVGKDNGDSWTTAEKWAVDLKEGMNSFVIKVINHANGTHPGAGIAEIDIDGIKISTDDTWLASTLVTEDEAFNAQIDRTKWQNASQYGGVDSSLWWNRGPTDTYGVSIEKSKFPSSSAAQWIYTDGFTTDNVVYLRKDVNISIISPLVRGNSIYTIVDGPSWTQAEANSVKLGGHLVTVNSQEENNFIWDELGIVGGWEESYGSGTVDPLAKSYWIGYTDKDREGSWKWASGDTSTYTNWHDERATGGDLSPNGGTRENFAYIGGVKDRSWDDAPEPMSNGGGTGAQGIAETSFIRRGNSAYVIVQGPTWEEAEANALKLGGHLVTINDAAENEFLYDKILTQKPDNMMFIGMNDADDDGTYTWSSGESISYLNWGFGEPSMRSYAGEENYGFVLASKSTDSQKGKWFDTTLSGNGGKVPYGIAEIKLASNNGPTGTPTLSGTFKAGQVITIDKASVQDADNFAGWSPEYTYRWEVANDQGFSQVPITWTSLTSADATDGNNTFTITKDLAGKMIRGLVSYMDGYGTIETVFSDPSTTIKSAGPFYTIDSVIDIADSGDGSDSNVSYGLYRISGLEGQKGSVLAITDAGLQQGQQVDSTDLQFPALQLLAANGKPLASSFLPHAIRKDGDNIEVLYRTSPSSNSYLTQDFSLTTGKQLGRPQSAPSLLALETAYDQDFTGDGAIGIQIKIDAVIDSSDSGLDADGSGTYGLYRISGINGSASSVLAVAQAGLEEGLAYSEEEAGKILPLLSAAGRPLPSSWVPIALRQDGNKLELLYQPKSGIASYQTQDFSLTTGKAVGSASTAFKSLIPLETTYGEDLDGDGAVGYKLTVDAVIDSSDSGLDADGSGTYGLYRISGINGSTSSVLAVAQAGLEEGLAYSEEDAGKILPLLSAAGRPLPSSWVPIALRQDGNKLELLYQPKSGIASYQTQDFSLTTGKAVGSASTAFKSLIPLETAYGEDLDGDGCVGYAFSDIGNTKALAGTATKDLLTVGSNQIGYAGSGDDTLVTASSFDEYDPITMIGGKGNDTYKVVANSFSVIYDLGSSQDSSDVLTGLSGTIKDWTLRKVELYDYLLTNNKDETTILLIDPLGKETAGNRLETIRFSRGAAQSITSLSTGPNKILSSDVLSYGSLADEIGKDISFAYGISPQAGPLSLKSEFHTNQQLIG